MRKIYYPLLILFFVSCAVSQKNNQSNNSPKSIYLQLYSVRDDIGKDFDKTIEAIAKMGYTGVEAASYSDGKFYGMQPLEYKEKLEQNNLEFLSSHTSYPLANKIEDTDWDTVWKWWEQAIEAHKEAGAKYIVAPWMRKPDNLKDLKLYCDYYNRVGEMCNDADLGFGYHNHDFEFSEIEGEIMYDFMIENTDADKVFFQMDVYWTVMGRKSPVAYLKKYPGRFELLHIKDQKELGESGMIGFDAIFKNMKTAGTKEIIVEVEQYNYQPIESVERSLKYLEKHFLD